MVHCGIISASMHHEEQVQVFTTQTMIDNQRNRRLMQS